MQKQNLIIIHSFPSNSIILKGFYDFLSDFFNVYPIDLPGFTPDKKPLAKMNFEGYRQYLEEEIARLNLERYFLGGISFGFAIANACRVDNRCRGFLAISPYLNNDYIVPNKSGIIVMKRLLFFPSRLRLLYRFIYHTRYFRHFLCRYLPSGRVDIMQKTVDGNAFFETAEILINHNEVPKFHDKPYVLLINEQDTTILASKVIELFETLDHALIVKTTIEHNPKDISKAYFKKHVPKGDIEKMVKK